MSWMKYRWVYFIISTLVIIPGLYSLVRYGLKPAIDFTGGTIWEIRFEKNQPEIKLLEEILHNQKLDFSQVEATNRQTYILHLAPLNESQVVDLKSAMADKIGEEPKEVRMETVGATLGKELLRKTIIAVALASLFIMFYLGRQFKNLKFGISAILAMFHDTLVLLGSFSLLGHFWGVEVDSLFVTAMLTILSFSVHDTVVIYNSIRESQKLYPHHRLEDLVDKAITETITRSLNNSLTIIFMLIALLLLGGATIKWFTVALLIGTVSGTYSSTFTAAPLLMVWDKLERRKNNV